MQVTGTRSANGDQNPVTPFYLLRLKRLNKPLFPSQWRSSFLQHLPRALHSFIFSNKRASGDKLGTYSSS